MSRFCTQCGQATTGEMQFCTSCGATFKVENRGPVSVPDSAAQTSSVVEVKFEEVATPSASFETTDAPNGKMRPFKSRWLVAAAAVVVVTGLTAGAVFAGRASVDTEEIRKSGFDSGRDVGYDQGYRAGESDGRTAGYESGRSEGYTSGYSDGCESVFKFSDMTADHVVPFDPYSYWDKYPGRYYTSRSGC